jgi:SAM-dependent methyltransferase
MMWFDKTNPDAIYCDQRLEQHILCDGRVLKIEPDLRIDFRAMPFPDNSFPLVVFDPPHLRHAGKNSWLRAKYGTLGEGWQEDLRLGFSECFRVLAKDGVLIFKWAEDQVKIKDVLDLSPVRPLFGHPTGRKGITHWVTFIKPQTLRGET